jgi:hypothetical protein
MIKTKRETERKREKKKQKKNKRKQWRGKRSTDATWKKRSERRTSESERGSESGTGNC